jgi:L-threonylcarbamoyladenylate synthase
VPTILDVTGDGREEAVERAAVALREGQLVVLPTDTTYGLAADAFSLDGTTRLTTLREQRRSVPLPVMVRSPKQLIGLTPVVPQTADRLMAGFWPGALTLVIVAEPSLKWELGDTQGTVAVRMPLDDAALEVIRAVGPLAVTGAHRAGAAPRATVEEIAAELGDEVAVYLDAGPRDPDALSTIVDLTRPTPHLLRDGRLPADIVLAVARGELEALEAADAIEGGATSLDEIAGPATDAPGLGERPDLAADGVPGSDPLADSAPVDAAPVDAPSDEAPADDARADEAPADTAPSDDAPSDATEAPADAVSDPEPGARG